MLFKFTKCFTFQQWYLCYHRKILDICLTTNVKFTVNVISGENEAIIIQIYQ